jgi:hypothetical protein
MALGGCDGACRIPREVLFVNNAPPARLRILIRGSLRIRDRDKFGEFSTWRPRRQQVLAAVLLGWSKLVPLPPTSTSMYSNLEVTVFILFLLLFATY